ncbi:unnamed protein product [Gongylonema pulchrum]|uniref:Uncharacterized protein n=1 Tax=Gongylonema pulchrum TaxID=637853 RepID=A0A183D245_9BILA|nr:unnamed protein product [Gongylonema pulchrum]
MILLHSGFCSDTVKEKALLILGSEQRTSLELHDLPAFSKHRKPLTVGQRQLKLEETLALPLNLEEPLTAAELCAPFEPGRPRTVSFTTPAGHRRDSSDDDDFVDRITARHHYV